MSKSIQIKAGTTRQETALTVALGIHINTNIKHYSSKAKRTIIRVIRVLHDLSVLHVSRYSAHILH